LQLATLKFRHAPTLPPKVTPISRA